MKKPKIIPAYLNKLTYNERKYASHQVLLGIMFGSYATYGFSVMVPFTSDPNKPVDVFSFEFLVFYILLSLMVLSLIKLSKYKKLIKLEPRVKQQKEDKI